MPEVQWQDDIQSDTEIHEGALRGSTTREVNVELEGQLK